VRPPLWERVPGVLLEQTTSKRTCPTCRGVLFEDKSNAHAVEATGAVYSFRPLSLSRLYEYYHRPNTLSLSISSGFLTMLLFRIMRTGPNSTHLITLDFMHFFECTSVYDQSMICWRHITADCRKVRKSSSGMLRRCMHLTIQGYAHTTTLCFKSPSWYKQLLHCLCSSTPVSPLQSTSGGLFSSSTPRKGESL
jgi:hypothetical protein